MSEVVRDSWETLRRLRSAAHKMRWGAGVVGAPATLRGLARFAAVKVRRPGTVEVALRSGGRLIADAPGQVVPALVVFGDLIDPEYPFLRRIARPDWVVVDVGAAIGQFTVFCARLEVAAVHSCEPSDDNLRSLRRNLEANLVESRVTVHRLALSDEAGEGLFATASTTYMSRLERSESTGGAAHVPVRRLADEVGKWGLERVDVLKVNVAGGENEVLAGADALFADGRVDVVVALVGRGSLTSYRLMAGHGYRFFFYHPREDTLYEVGSFGEELLTWRPSPARHILAIRAGAVSEGCLGDIRIRRAPI